jgi:N-acetylmuramoyl-L-alanine amidase
MKFKKLVLCLFAVVITLNFLNMKAYAAEEVTINQLEGTTEELAGVDEETTVSEDQTGADEETAASEELDGSTEDAAASDESGFVEDTSISETVEEDFVDLEQESNKEDVSEDKETKKEDKEVKNYTDGELRLLSALIYCEANGESYNGKLAVGIVVMNRKRSSLFPDTVKDVIYQKYQFSPARNGSLKKALEDYDNGKFTSASEKECIKAAKAALNGTTSITVNGKKKNFSKYLYFSCSLGGYTFKLGNHKFK